MKTDNNHDYFTKVHCVRDLKIIIIIIIIVFTISQFGMFSTYTLLPVLQRKSRNKYVSLSLRWLRQEGLNEVMAFTADS